MCFHTAEHDIWTFMHEHKEKNRRTSTHTHIHQYTHTSQRLCESQKAEPEGCCVSDVCIVYSVVPVHVGDCCTLRPHSGLLLFTMTGVDSRLLSRRPERPSKERGGEGGGGRDRRYTCICSHTASLFFLVSLWSLLLKPLPHGSPAVRQPEEGAASLLILSSLTFCHLGYTPFCTRGIIWEP